MNNESLKFRVSTGLKNIIGKDLISDSYIAVFELVKNSYDAGATRVTISFVMDLNGNPQLRIEDDGCGMDYEDIVGKWLFVAYSAKKKENRSTATFRERIKREMAGAKGVGRFSCDRLGKTLALITKTANELVTHEVLIHWDQFEQDDSQEFIDIPVKYSVRNDLPLASPKGTLLVISDLRDKWDRAALQSLKRSLMRLISPDSDSGTLPFEIEIIAPEEKAADELATVDRDVVNGIVRNDVLEKMNIKTTSVEVLISEDGESIQSTLMDRGERIITLLERNVKYRMLHNIRISLFYLNRAAKAGFTKQMGIQPVHYGSIFVYKNGFRIYPYGEPEQDFFNIDKRKAQGYHKNLGTRELMGRIAIQGDNSDFVETSSRAHGFIESPSVLALSGFFLEKVLRVLERYVVNIISWGEPLKSTTDGQAIQPVDLGEEVIDQLLRGINKQDIIDYDFNRELLLGRARKSDSVTDSLRKLEKVAAESGDLKIAGIAKDIGHRTEAILTHNIELERANEAREQELERTKQVSAARERQVYFLKGATHQSVENLINGMHTIFTLTEAEKQFLGYLRKKIGELDFEQKGEMLSLLAEALQANQKANKLAELAIKGNQHLRQEGRNDVFDYISQYIDSGLAPSSISYEIVPPSFPCECKFDPSSLGVIIDNISSNSIKAFANQLTISFAESRQTISIEFTDNGGGLSPALDPSLLFEWGVSTTQNQKGFGIGLYHIKQLVEDMSGSVAIDQSYTKGFRMVVSLRK